MLKKTLFTTLLLLATAFSFTACEKNDYQHPGHRSN